VDGVEQAVTVDIAGSERMAGSSGGQSSVAEAYRRWSAGGSSDGCRH